MWGVVVSRIDCSTRQTEGEALKNQVKSPSKSTTCLLQIGQSASATPVAHTYLFIQPNIKKCRIPVFYHIGEPNINIPQHSFNTDNFFPTGKRKNKNEIIPATQPPIQLWASNSLLALTKLMTTGNYLLTSHGCKSGSGLSSGMEGSVMGEGSPALLGQFCTRFLSSLPFSLCMWVEKVSGMQNSIIK